MCERSKIDRTLKENERLFSKIMTTRQVTLARGEKLTYPNKCYFIIKISDSGSACNILLKLFGYL